LQKRNRERRRQTFGQGKGPVAAPAGEPAHPVGLGILSPADSWGAQLFMIAAFVGASLLAIGYTFGQEDQVIHLALIERAREASFLSGDPMVDASVYHPSMLWQLFGLLSRLVPLEELYFGVYLLTLAAAFGGTAALARSLQPSKASNSVGILAALMVLLPRGPFGGIETWDNMVLNRTISLGPLLYALALGCSGRFRAGFFLSGLVFNLHPTMGTHGAILLWCGALASGNRRRDALIGPLFFLLAAAPLTLLMALSGAASGVPTPAPADWLDAQRTLVWFHHFPSTWPPGIWWVLAPSGVALFLALRVRRNFIVIGYLAGIALACGSGFVGVELLHLPSALHLHLQETLRFLPYLAAACLSGWAAVHWTGTLLEKASTAAAVASLALDQVLGSPLQGFSARTSASFLVLVVVLAVQILRPARGPAAPAMRIPLALALVLLVPAAGLGRWKFRPGFQSRYDELPEARVTHWVRENLPATALLVVPPDYAPARLNIRWAARRRVLVTLKDGSEASFSVKLFSEWRRRMEDLIERPLRFSAGGKTSFEETFRWIEDVYDGYRRADAGRFRRLAETYGATHAIVESRVRPQPDLPLLYRDALYSVYEIRR
jgi:hypothetical protein